MLSALTAAAFVLSSLVPPPGPVTVEVLSVTGSGCPPNTAQVAMSPDNQAFTVTYSDFLVQARGTEAKRSCRLTLRVNHPQDHTYGIAETDYRGFAHLEAGARGAKKASYHFADQAPTRHSTKSYAGPLSDNWQVTDKPEPGKVVHGPCKERKPLTIEAELKVNALSGTSFMTMDSTDSSVSAKFKLSWKKC